MTSTVSPPRRPGATAWAAPGRRRGTRRRRGLRIVVALLVLMLVGTAVWIVYFSTVLDTRAVRVSGAGRLTPQQVTQAAHVPLGLPLVRQDLNEIARRATGLAPVAAARVTRRWPHTVQLRITERQPLFGVARTGDFVVVDAEGVAFAAVASLPQGVVRVEADLTDRPLLSELGVVVAAMPGDLRRQVTTIRATGRDDVVVSLRSGVTVRWGDAQDSPLKAAVTKTLLTRKPKASIDVSSPEHPAVR